jgi:hypothetical protein
MFGLTQMIAYAKLVNACYALSWIDQRVDT